MHMLNTLPLNLYCLFNLKYILLRDRLINGIKRDHRKSEFNERFVHIPDWETGDGLMNVSYVGLPNQHFILSTDSVKIANTPITINEKFKA